MVEAQRYRRLRSPETACASRRDARGSGAFPSARSVRFTQVVHLWHPSGMHGSIFPVASFRWASLLLDHRLISADRSAVEGLADLLDILAAGLQDDVLTTRLATDFASAPRFPSRRKELNVWPKSLSV